MKWTTDNLLEATKGNLLFGDSHRSFTGISIDSRIILPDQIFAAIKGDKHDGHRFASEVIRLGVKCLIIENSSISDLPVNLWKEQEIICIGVNDTRKALGNLSTFHLMRSKASVIAITGSNGKTSTREMTSAVLSQKFTILTTKGNLNNDIGLPLTLLNLTPSHQWAVVELGMNHPGEITALARICLPDIGMITNIGPAHLEGLGSLDAIMRAKGELITAMKPEGTVIFNADDSRVMQLSQETSKKKILFGLSANADVRAASIKEIDTGTQFTLILPSEQVPVNLPIFGKFMVSNALAAASAGYLLGITGQEIAKGLEHFTPVKGRMNIVNLKNGIHLIDDTYNANPRSMEAAIVTLSSLKGNHRRIVVTGDMLELGAHSESMHNKIGSVIAKSNVTRLYVTGNFAESVAEGAKNNGMDSIDITIGSKEQIIKELLDYLEPEDWILVKGSRGMKMEEIVNKLKEWAEK